MIDLLNKSLETAKKIAKLRRQAPDFQLWKSIEEQLNFIISDFSMAGGFLHQAKEERVSQIIMGLQAVRELEATDPALADLLCEINYEYKALYAAG